MLKDDQLKAFDDFINGIVTTIQQYPVAQRYCSIEAIVEGTVPLFCLIRAGCPRSKRAKSLDYGKFRLVREIVTVDTLQSRLNALAQSNRFDLSTGALEFQTIHRPVRQTFYPSRSVYHQWPGCLYEIAWATNQAVNVSQEPLVGHGLPPFFHLRDAIKEWTRVPVADTDGRFWRLLLFVPSFKAQLTQLKFQKGMLTVQSVVATKSKLDLSVVAADGKRIERLTAILKPRQRMKLMEAPTSLRVFISDRDGQILDQFAEEQAYSTGERVIFTDRHKGRRLLELIRSGESDRVEFKPFVRLEDRTKVAEIVKTVIAFANTQGGTIFIGVSDGGEIEGVESNRPNNPQRSRTFFQDYVEGLKKLLRDRLNRVPGVTVRAAHLGDRVLIVLEVPEGDCKPYFNLETREVFVRRGASNMRPDPDSFFGVQRSGLDVFTQQSED